MQRQNGGLLCCTPGVVHRIGAILAVFTIIAVESFREVARGDVERVGCLTIRQAGNLNLLQDFWGGAVSLMSTGTDAANCFCCGWIPRLLNPAINPSSVAFARKRRQIRQGYMIARNETPSRLGVLRNSRTALEETTTLAVHSMAVGAGHFRFGDRDCGSR